MLKLKIIGLRKDVLMKHLERFDKASIEGGEKIDLSAFMKQIDGYVESFKFNKVISSFMEFYNKNKNKLIDKNI